MNEYIDGTLIQTSTFHGEIEILIGEDDYEFYHNVYINVNKAEELIKDLQRKVRKLKAIERRKHRNKNIFEDEYSALRERADRFNVNYWDLK